nr:MAG TPA: hypothetical protein [Caudoviricetes sp.]
MRALSPSILSFSFLWSLNVSRVWNRYLNSYGIAV